MPRLLNDFKANPNELGCIMMTKYAEECTLPNTYKGCTLDKVDQVIFFSVYLLFGCMDASVFVGKGKMILGWDINNNINSFL